MMKLTIELSEDDIREVTSTVLTVGEMFDTTRGRVICAIAKAAREEWAKANNVKLD